VGKHRSEPNQAANVDAVENLLQGAFLIEAGTIKARDFPAALKRVERQRLYRTNPVAQWEIDLAKRQSRKPEVPLRCSLELANQTQASRRFQSPCALHRGEHYAKCVQPTELNGPRITTAVPVEHAAKPRVAAGQYATHGCRWWLIDRATARALYGTNRRRKSNTSVLDCKEKRPLTDGSAGHPDLSIKRIHACGSGSAFQGNPHGQ